MPHGVVKGKKQEKQWNDCKQSVRAAHPDVKGDRYWAMVNGCFQKKKRALMSGA